MQHIKRIIEIQIRKLTKMIADRGSPSRSATTPKSSSRRRLRPAFGARPLKRALQKLIIDPLAMKLLEGKFKPGDIVFATVRASESSTFHCRRIDEDDVAGLNFPSSSFIASGSMISFCSAR